MSFRLSMVAVSGVAAVAWTFWSSCPASAASGPHRSKPRSLPQWRRPADPEPLLTAEYLELLIGREKGVLKLISVEKNSFRQPQLLLPRFRGRFEVRLLAAGGQLRDVVRFDFPLTGGAAPAESPDLDDVLGRKLAAGVSARIRVRVPFDASIASAVIFDSLSKAAVQLDLSRFRGGSAAPQWQPPILRKSSFKKTKP